MYAPTRPHRASRTSSPLAVGRYGAAGGSAPPSAGGAFGYAIVSIASGRPLHRGLAHRQGGKDRCSVTGLIESSL